MKATALGSSEHPKFRLMTQDDVVSFYHLQVPRWLFAEPKYRKMSLTAKMAYAFLLNRFQLSRRNGWQNGDGEVFVIFTRESLAGEMQISYRKAIESFKELVANGLIWEKRCGRGEANQIYLARVELNGDRESGAYECAPFLNPAPEKEEAREPDTGSAETAGHETEPEKKGEENSQHRTENRIPAGNPDMPDPHIWTCKNRRSRRAETAGPEVPKRHTSNTEPSQIELKEIDPPHEDGEFQKLIRLCEPIPLFQEAAERLYRTRPEGYRVGGAVIPPERVREKLKLLNDDILNLAYRKYRENVHGSRPRSKIAYAAAILYNTLSEAPIQDTQRKTTYDLEAFERSGAFDRFYTAEGAVNCRGNTGGN